MKTHILLSVNSNPTRSNEMESENTLSLVTFDFLMDCGVPANDPRGQFVFDGHDYVITGSVGDMFTVQAVEQV